MLQEFSNKTLLIKTFVITKLTSNLCDTERSSFNRAFAKLWLLVGGGQAHQGKNNEGGDETHLALVL